MERSPSPVRSGRAASISVGVKMLLQNKSFLTCNGLRYLAGAPAVSGVLARSDLTGQGNSKLNRFIGEAKLYKGDATPSGYSLTGGAWYPSRFAGGMSARYSAIGSGTVRQGSLAGGFNLTAPALAGVGSLSNADAFMAIFGTATLIGLGSISNAAALGAVELAATLLGQGDLTGSLISLLDLMATLDGEGSFDSDISGAVEAAVSLLGQGDFTGSVRGLVELTATLLSAGELSEAGLDGVWNMAVSLYGTGAMNALLVAIADVTSVLAGTGAIHSALPYASGSIGATIRSFSDLSPEGLSGAVWGAAAVQNNASGSMGQKLNSAASGGVDYSALAEAVWAVSIETGYSAEELMRLMSAVLAGKASGAGTSVVKFRDVGDTKDRVTASVDQVGNRLTVTTDVG
jgi:hypothetical protein